MDSFILFALLAGIGVAAVAGVLGCFVIWRRMAYFGDSLAHSSLLGIAIGMLYGMNLNISIIIICFLFAILLLWLKQKHILATDTLLGILAHAGLAIGMVVISFVKFPGFNLHNYLFGDILTITERDLYWIYIGGFVTLTLIAFNWPSLMLTTISEDIAKAEGVNTLFINILLVALMTIVVAVSIRIVGILLITSMLIIPAATARQIARSPEIMAIFSSCFGIIAVLLGIYLSTQFDTPSGPSIVSAAVMLFISVFTVSSLARKRS